MKPDRTSVLINTTPGNAAVTGGREVVVTFAHVEERLLSAFAPLGDVVGHTAYDHSR